MYRQERTRLLREIAALKARPATPKQIEDRENDLHVLETDRLRKIGRRYGFDIDSQVDHWQMDADQRRRWLLPTQRLVAAEKIRAAKKLWVKEWIQILSPIAGVIIALFAAIISLGAFALSVVALYLKITGKAP